MNLFKKLKMCSLKKKIQKQHDLRESGEAGKLDDYVNSLLDLANFLKENRYNKAFPFADLYEVECYRVASAVNNPEAQFRLAERSLDRARFFDDLSNSAFASEQQKKYAEHYFQEAFTLLKNAGENGHALAMRLYGMIHVKGWGMPIDTDQGFAMVIESINLENAWNRATKIFESLGLNSPEFFAALSKNKKS